MQSPLRNSIALHSGSDAEAAASTQPVEAAFALSAEEAAVLSDAGFLAAVHGDVLLADLIFEPLCHLRSGRAYPWIGKTLARLNAGQAVEAVVFLEAASGSNAEEESVLRAWHGLALQLAGHRAQSVALLTKVTEMNGSGARLARAFLGIRAPGDSGQHDARSKT